jgi:hypothetical protein
MDGTHIPARVSGESCFALEEPQGRALPERNHGLQFRYAIPLRSTWMGKALRTICESSAMLQVSQD